MIWLVYKSIKRVKHEGVNTFTLCSNGWLFQGSWTRLRSPEPRSRRNWPGARRTLSLCWSTAAGWERDWWWWWWWGQLKLQVCPVCPEHVEAAPRRHGDRQRAEEHAGSAGQQGDRGGPIREHCQRPDHRSLTQTLPNPEESKRLYLLTWCCPPAESRRLQQDLEKVQQLEGKIGGELSTLKEQVSTMETELLTYRDLDALRRSADDKRKVGPAAPGTQQHPVTKRWAPALFCCCRGSRRSGWPWVSAETPSSSCWRRWTRNMKPSRPSCRRTRRTLRLERQHVQPNALSTFVSFRNSAVCVCVCVSLVFQLTNLERKWQHLEQNNFVMKECILHRTHQMVQVKIIFPLMTY